MRVRAVKLHVVSCFTLWVVETMSVKRIVIADLNLCTCQTLSENIQASHDENSNPARPLRSTSNQLEDWSLRWLLGWSHIIVKGKGVKKKYVKIIYRRNPSFCKIKTWEYSGVSWRLEKKFFSVCANRFLTISINQKGKLAAKTENGSAMCVGAEPGNWNCLFC